MPPRREAGIAGAGSAGADRMPVLPLAENHDDERESGCIVVLAVRGVRTGLECRTAPPGEPAGVWRAVGMSRGCRRGDPE